MLRLRGNLRRYAQHERKHGLISSPHSGHRSTAGFQVCIVRDELAYARKATGHSVIGLKPY